MPTDHRNLQILTLCRSVITQSMFHFGVVFFYQIFGESVALALIFAGLGYLLTTLFYPIYFRYHNQIHTSTTFSISFFLYIIIFLCLYLASLGSYQYLLMGIYIVSFAIARGLFQSNFNVAYTNTLDEKHISSDLGFVESLNGVVNFLHPLLAGFLTFWLEELGLLILVAFTASIGIFYSLKISNFEFKTDTNLTNQLKDRTNDRLALMSLWVGPAIAQTFMWSLLVFLIVKEDFRTIGYILAFVSLVASISFRFIGKFMDHSNTPKLFSYTKLVFTFAMILRGLSNNILLITISNILARLTGRTFMFSFDSLQFAAELHKSKYVLNDDRVFVSRMFVDTGLALSLFLMAAIYSWYGFSIAFFAMAAIFFAGFVASSGIMPKMFKNKV